MEGRVDGVRKMTRQEWGEFLMMQQAESEKPKPRELPATQDVRRDVRRALERLPAEYRPEMEQILRESGALPKNTLPAEKQPE